MEKGQIVCSKAGSDKNGFSVITEINGKYVLICNGKRHKLANPKRKNIKHLAAMEEVLGAEKFLTDKALRAALAVYRRNKE